MTESLREIFSPEAKPASIDVCATQCHAKCCRAPGFLQMSATEMRRVKAIANLRKIKTHIMNMPQAGKNPWIIDFDRAGGQCPFLGDDYSCTIHEDRPDSCRRFPNQPTHGCAVRPGYLPQHGLVLAHGEPDPAGLVYGCDNKKHRQNYPHICDEEPRHIPWGEATTEQILNDLRNWGRKAHDAPNT